MIKIVRCNDPTKWYYRYVGYGFPFLDEEEEEYKTTQPEGYVNFISKEDGVLVDRNYE